MMGKSIWLRAISATALSALTALVVLVSPLAAQNVTSQLLTHPTPDSWPGFHGDYSGRRHTELKQITPENVHGLTLAWAYQTN